MGSYSRQDQRSGEHLNIDAEEISETRTTKRAREEEEVKPTNTKEDKSEDKPVRDEAMGRVEQTQDELDIGQDKSVHQNKVRENWYVHQIQVAVSQIERQLMDQLTQAQI